MTRIVGNISNSKKQFRFVTKSQILTPDRMNVIQYFDLRFEMEQQSHQSEVKVFKLSGCRQNVEKCVGKCRKCREISENDSELFLTYLRYLNAILTFDFLHIGKEK